MTGFWAQIRSFSRPSRVLMINQFGASIGFYMLMPYLSSYLAGTLGLAAWAVGLVLGVRNSSQQGMFFVGGTLADRLGYKPLIVAGCLLRIGAFGLLAIAQSLSTLLFAAAATGFAGALFNPALRAYLATEADDRRIEAFATLNMFNRAGVFLGPLIGLAFVTSNFRMSVLAARVIFAVLAIAQLLALPGHRFADRGRVAPAKTSIISDWRAVAGNRSFFTVRRHHDRLLSAVLPDLSHASHAGLSGGATLPSTIGGSTFRYVRPGCGGRPAAHHPMVLGTIAAGAQCVHRVALMAASFAPLAAIPNSQRLGTPAAVAALLAAAAPLAVASAAVFPFEMHIVVSLSSERLVTTHYGFYNTIIGVGILAGNFAIGALLGTEHRLDTDELVWAALILVGLIAATGLYRHDTKINVPGRAVPD